MGGGDGGVIVKDGVQKILTDPQVHGRLPATMAASLDAALYSDYPANTILSDPSKWSQVEKEVVGRAAHWAVCNL
jgi:hypothetical protein